MARLKGIIRYAHPSGRRKLRCLASLGSNPSGVLFAEAHPSGHCRKLQCYLAALGSPYRRQSIKLAMC